MTDRESRRVLGGIGFIMLAVSIFAMVDALAKYLSLHYSITTVVWARYFFQMVVMIVLLGPRIGFGLVRSRRPFFQLIRGIVLTASSLLFFTALTRMKLAEAAAITFLAPLVIAVLAGPVLHERTPPSSWVATIAGLIGVQLIIRPGTEVFSWWALLPLFTAILMACYQLMTRRIANVDRAYTSLFYPAVVGSAAMTIALPAGSLWPDNAWHGALFVLIGVLGGIGHYLLIRAYERAPATILAPFVYAQLMGALILGYLVFGNFPDVVSLCGMAIIVMAGVYVVTRQRRPS